VMERVINMSGEVHLMILSCEDTSRKVRRSRTTSREVYRGWTTSGQFREIMKYHDGF